MEVRLLITARALKLTYMTETNTEASQIKIVQLIAKELNAGAQQVASAVGLLDEGATVPFIARYRKEATGNLDDTQLRNLEDFTPAES